MPEELKVIITADDRASARLSGLKTTLGAVGHIAGTVALAGVATAGAGIVALGVDAVQAGSDAEEMLGKFNTVFRDLAGPVTDELATFADEVGRNRFNLMEFAATLQDTFVPLGFARDEAAGMSTELVKLATDLASFNNLDTATVVRDLQSALVGNTETLRKYGVVANQTQIEQYALENAIWDGEEALTAQEKAAAILGLTIAGTADAQGDAARTSESWANRMRALKAGLVETRTEIGLELLPVVTPLLEDFGELAKEVLPALTEVFVKFFRHLKDDIGPEFANIQDALERIAVALGGTTDDADLLTMTMSALESVLNGVAEAVRITAGFMQLVAWVLERARYTVDIFSDSWGRLGDKVRDALGSIANIDLRSIGVGLMDGLIGGIFGHLQYVVGAARIVADAITGFFREQWGRLKDAGIHLMDGLRHGIWEGIGWIIDAASGVAQAAVDAFRNIWDSRSPSRVFEQIGRDAMAGLASGLSGSLQPQLAVAGVAGGVVSEVRTQTTHNVQAPITINVSDRIGLADVQAMLRDVLE